MEDLKKIQEFFSKPLNENVFVEAFKLQKALKGMGYDVKVKAVDDFGTNVFEIYFNNPADADDDSIFYDVEKLGYDNVRVFANPQESLEEAYIVTYAKSKGEKPASAAYKHRGSALAFIRDLEKDGYITMLTQKPVDGVDESVKENSHFEKRLAKMAADEKEKRAKSPSYAAASKLDVDIEDFFEKGQSYQEFKKRLDKLKEYNSGIYFDPDKAPKRSKKVSKSTLDKIADIVRKAAVGGYEPTVTENEELQVKVGNYQTKHFDICPGAVAVYKDIEVEDMDLAERASKLQDALFAMEKEALENGASDLDVEAAQILADQIMAMAKMMGLEKEHSYVQGHVEKIKGTLSEALADYEEKEADYDKMYSDYKYKVNEAKPKKATGEKISKELFSKLKGKTITYKGHDYKVLDSDEAVLKIKHLEDGDVTTINLKQFNVSGMIEEILETIELGKQLEEGKLCPKGEAYRKRRMAAGEKSSAYLSGRAVKVCKGQMSGKKKKKK